MLLYQIVKNSKLYLQDEDGEEIQSVFLHTDGMYSFCITEYGKTFHLSVMTPLEEYKDGYRIKE